MTDDELLIGLHMVLFKRAGTGACRKNNLYAFSGLACAEGAKEQELSRLRERLGKWSASLLLRALDLLRLPHGTGEGARREARAERLAGFLAAPPGPGGAQGGGLGLAIKAEVKAECHAGVKLEVRDEGERGAIAGEEAQGGACPSSQRKRKAVKEEREAWGEEGRPGPRPVPTDEELSAATLELLRVCDVNTTTVKDLVTRLQQRFGQSLEARKLLIKEVAVEYCTCAASVPHARCTRRRGRRREGSRSRCEGGAAAGGDGPLQPAAVRAEPCPAVKAEPQPSPSSRNASGSVEGEEEEREAEAVEAVEAEAVEAVEQRPGPRRVPTDEELTAATLELLKVCDVNTTTVKDLVTRLQQRFGQSLEARKLLIKEVAVEYCNAPRPYSPCAHTAAGPPRRRGRNRR
ncbi:hypothetical protein HYH03_009198 [Edaphochlamys debaryana]|uniref:DEK-C domain-containing protein n=1 Tax=Edaphochlamys debaryana TaxID=47281 RepID=A0A835Y0S3_9CHLO|nr:hypothetical protein HYH03_009198 [Edaphochlamys debaryana]|eukprot:KAG2492533.1 hypothetical protein HYH03_009198 [Edaphochlamys debaryana]